MPTDSANAAALRGMTLRVEFFPDDLGASPYAMVECGTVRIGAARAWEQVEPRARSVPAGVEIVLEVDDVTVLRDRVRAAGYPLEQDLERRPRGLTDFRVHDPAGYYLRVTSRA